MLRLAVLKERELLHEILGEELSAKSVDGTISPCCLYWLIVFTPPELFFPRFAAGQSGSQCRKRVRARFAVRQAGLERCSWRCFTDEESGVSAAIALTGEDSLSGPLHEAIPKVEGRSILHDS